MSTKETRQLISKISKASWMHELEKTSSKYHIIAAWVAVIFDPIFGFTDYLNIPDSWINVFILRCSIAVITLMVIFAKKKRPKIPSFVVALVPFVLISLQNAYTYALITNENLLGHSLNYTALLVGAAMFVLWHWAYSVAMIVLSVIATAYFIYLNPDVTVDQFFLEGGLILTMVAVFMIVLINARYNLTLKEIKARLALRESNDALEEQKEIVEEKNKKITDSIQYAKRIQAALLGTHDRIEGWFSDNLVLFIPKDVLSGDFYWYYQDKDKDTRVIIAADCTGHGVPAALMTVLGNSLLNEIVAQEDKYLPHEILERLDQKIVDRFSKNSEGNYKVNDGMDMSILVFHQGKIFFSGAKNPLLIVRTSELGEPVYAHRKELAAVADKENCQLSLEEKDYASYSFEILKGSSFPIGSTQFKKKKEFVTHEIKVKQGDKLYMYSDGYQDQFGGPNVMKYMSGKFRRLLVETAYLPMKEQLHLIENEYYTWKGHEKQTDDVLIIGVEV